MTKQELKRKHPQEQLLMFDCPNCGQEVNKKFVEKIVDDIEQVVRKEMVKKCKKIAINNFYLGYQKGVDIQIEFDLLDEEDKKEIEDELKSNLTNLLK